LETGRTHQIRVHMKHIGHPLIGDFLYNPSCDVPMQRQALHSYRLSFCHPLTGKELDFTCEPPEDMKRLLPKNI
ncbi:MAG: RluA family pseudouridine synthase, partial [Lachnospiraceae bacterium]|nr:RluA family pseudouridine synthase [Lachnospiraceae bacterium]